MKEKVLILASVASMIDQFNMSNIDILLSLNYEVHVACNFEKGSTCSEEKINQLKSKLADLNVKYFQIDFTRSVFNIAQDIKAYKQVKKIMIENNYKFIHCHSPIGGVVGRIACHKMKIKCIYTAHGFHFFKGAPIINWLLFYPIEKYLSKYTDVLITINKEDYERANKKLKMKTVEYVPGVGIDIGKFQLKNFNREIYRKKLGLTDSDFMVLSVGELNKNKNHEVVIKAISKLSNKNVHYYIAGKGELKDYLCGLSIKLKMDKQIHLLGFRRDVNELLHCSDIYIHPSLREGLPVSIIEAMASGTTIIASNIRGNNDLIVNNRNGFLTKSNSISNYEELIELIIDNKERINMFKKNNEKDSKKYSNKVVENEMLKIYRDI